jgi:hypothetical protein
LSKKLIFSKPTLEPITFSEDVTDVTGLEGTEVARGGDVQSTYPTMSHPEWLEYFERVEAEAKGLAEKEKVGVVGKGKTTQPKRASTSTAKSTAKKGSTKPTVAKGAKRNSKKTTVDQRDNLPSGSSCKMPVALSVQDEWLCYEEVAGAPVPDKPRESRQLLPHLALEEGPCGREEICYYVQLQTQHR